MDKTKEIKDLIDSDDVVIFMKGTPDFPQCGFSANVIGILNYFNIKYTSFNVLENNSIREEIKLIQTGLQFLKFILKEFIGGCDIIRELAESGEIEDLLKKHKIEYNIKN